MVLCKNNITSYIGEGDVIAYWCVFSTEFMSIAICGSMQACFRVCLVVSCFEGLDYR